MEGGRGGVEAWAVALSHLDGNHTRLVVFAELVFFHECISVAKRGSVRGIVREGC